MTFLNAKLIVSILMVIAALVTCNRVRLLRKFPISMGIFLGAVALVHFHLMWNQEELSPGICFMDCIFQMAIYLFTPAVGIVAFLLFSIGQLLQSTFVFEEGWGYPMPFIASYLAVVLLACWLKRNLFRNQKPSICATPVVILLGQIITILLLGLFLPKSDFIEDVFHGLLPELTCKVVCAVAVIAMCRNNYLLMPRPMRGYIGMAAGYIVILLLLSSAYVATTIRNCHRQMHEALEAMVNMPGVGVSKHLFSTCNSLVKNEKLSGGATALTQLELESLLFKYGLDDITIIRQDGTLVCSANIKLANNQDYSNIWKHRFYPLMLDSDIGGVENVFSADHVPQKRKLLYAFVPFEDKSGFLFVAVSWDYYVQHSDVLGIPDVANCDVGKGGTYMVVDKNSYKIKGVRQIYDNLLEQKIMDRSPFAKDMDGNKCYIVRKFGYTGYFTCREIGGYYYVIIVPIAEIFIQYGSAVRFISILLLLVLVAIVRVRTVAIRKHWDKVRDEYRRNKQRNADLITAKSIQTSVLPKNFPPYPWDLTLDLYASMHPAYEVGGDFYEFFYIGLNKILVLIADVSGKGIPAAMFMMQAKSLLRTCIQEKTDLGEAMTEVNRRLCQDNVAEMFVTCWAGILNTDSGSLEYVNAGHNPPYILHRDNSLTALDSISGFFLAGLDDTVYIRYETKLLPGDTLFLYTDGITEANNTKQQMFEETRLENVLKTFDQNCQNIQRMGLPIVLCNAVNDNVGQFIAGAPQFDDMTMLALHYRGPCVEEKFVVTADCEGQVLLADSLDNRLKAMGCPQEKHTEMMIALDEVTTNICSYSGSNEITMILRICHKPEILILEFVDSGKPYDPMQAPPPNLTNDDDRPIGGLGLFMLKKLVDNLNYNYTDGKNHFLLFKRLN